MEVILNVATYISALCGTSVFSAGYLVLAVCVSMQIMVLRVCPANLYFVLLLTALAAMGTKVVLLVMLLTQHLDGYCGQLLNYLGFDCEVLEGSWAARVVLFAGDFPVLVACLATLGLKQSPFRKSLAAVERYWLWLVSTYLAIVGVAVSSCSYVNLLYLLLALLWAIVSTFRNRETSYLLLSAGTFGISALTVLAFGIYQLFQTSSPSIATAESGLNFLSFSLLPSDILIITVLYLSIKTFQLSWYRLKVDFNLPDNPFANLSSQPRSPAEANDSGSGSIGSPGTSVQLNSGRKWRWYRSVGLMFFLLRVMVTLWAVYFMSVVGIVQLYWIFRSILVGNSSKAMAELPVYLLPSLVLQVLTDYILTILQLSPDPMTGAQHFVYPQAETAFMLITISLGFLCYSLNANAERALLPSNSTASVSSLALVILLQNSDKAALCILFGVGLSSINILHTGLMGLCLLFTLNQKGAQRHWAGLVIYTILMIAVPYLWILVLKVVEMPWQDWQQAASIIGLPLHSEYTRVLLIFPPDYLSWCLLLTVSMQLSAYRSMSYTLKFREFGLSRMSRTYALLLECLTKAFRIVVEMQVWVVYCLLLLVVFLSELNVLNYIRYLQILAFIMLHMHCGNESISRGYQKVKAVWVTLPYYSGILLVIRYIYQFRAYYSGTLPFEWYLQFAGLQVYSTATLYEAMIGDVVILIVSIFTAKSFHTENRIALYTNSSRNSSFSGEGGVLYELLRADAGNRSEAEMHYHSIMKVIAEPFAKVLMLVVALLAFYWRLAGAFWLMLCVIGIYMLLESGHQHYLVRISN